MKKKMPAIAALMMTMFMILGACSDNVPSSGNPASGETQSSNSANGATQPESSATTKDTLVIANTADPTSFDPYGPGDTQTTRITQQIYETLVMQTEDMEIVPCLATEWEFEDETTMVFKLRQGVKFHNGEDFTAKDVKFSFQRAAVMPKTMTTAAPIDAGNIEIIDDYTVRIPLRYTFGPILGNMSYRHLTISSEAAFNTLGEDAFMTTPIGTGPYKYALQVPGDRVEVVRNDDYWGGAPYFETLIFRTIIEPVNRTIELESGGVDFAFDVLSNDIARIQENPGLEMLTCPNLYTTYLAFNTRKEEFQDVRVRQAISYAVDMESIVKLAYGGTGTVAYGPMAPTVWGFDPDLLGVVPYKRDIEKAKALLKEAGYENGFAITLGSHEDQQRMNVIEIIQNQLKDVGITAEVKIAEWAAYLQECPQGVYDMFMMGMGNPTADADYSLYMVLHSSCMGTAGNFAYFNDPETDRLLDLGRQSNDTEVRLQAYKDVQARIIEQAPWLFVQHGEVLQAVNSDIKGLIVSPTSNILFSRAYMD